MDRMFRINGGVLWRRRAGSVCITRGRSEQEGDKEVNVMKNAGAASWLHQRAVALLYDELTRPDFGRGKDEELRVRLLNGDLSCDLRAGVEKVKVPGEWDSVGGIVPDLILYSADETPVRIIEVIVTNPPSEAKWKKLDTLQRRGVDVVEVQLSDEKDLLTLCWVPLTPNFKSLTRFDRLSANIAQDSYNRGERGKQDKKVEDLRVALQTCSPSVRRDFWNVFNHLGDLDSLYPVRPGNPLHDVLRNNRKGDKDRGE